MGELLSHEEHCDSLLDLDNSGVAAEVAEGVRESRYVLEEEDDPDDARFSRLGGVRTVLVGS